MIEKMGAVLTYYGEIDLFKGLYLFNNKEEWERVVKCNRSSGKIKLSSDFKNRFSMADYIIGNMSGGRCKYSDPEYCPTKRICLKSDDMSEAFSLKKVVFSYDQ